MRRIWFILFFGGLILNCSTSNDNGEVTKIDPEPKEEEVVGVIRDISPSALVADMGPGWNFGNSFDVRDNDKTAWGNPLPTTTVVDAVFNRGFRTIRVPVTWGYNMADAPTYEIEENYFSRVTTIVDYALNKGMYVIINVHHDDKWIIPTFDNASATNTQLDRVWTQIANSFKNYSDYLIFELLNEPRHKDTPEQWTGGTEEGREVLNDFYKTIVDAIRRTGGNNAKRKLMIAPYAASVVQKTWDDLVIPNNDPDVIISIHAYVPFRFALDASDPDWGSDTDKADIDALMNRIDNNFMSKGFPVVMGEWGSIGLLAEASERLKHAEYFVNACIEKGIVPVVWDDGGDFGLLDRRNFVWDFPTLADAAANKN
ncbi:glycoside hydrolase family 5 protein [Hyunsoonleella pacifica]|uniref:Glycoside hydrolase family 5 protein n=1 Tax=Hyunsoonleella pacifica TaxID=1080224 RepID=A0A4Q9FRW2_9FLAO|nr:glycoside hydrolase family 5 protein [Hyunsoonleella pacifica]TBN18536.1 glycoside hydrolase family 5 protein [Hyunsoonleella pacifica]GGD02618.1 endoglucanase [Hyunsoonleella pacifica]